MSGVGKKLRKAQAKVKKVLEEVKKVEKFANAPMRSSGRAIGAKLGNRKAGEAIGSILGKVMGTGDYVIRSNTLTTVGGAVDSAPQFTKNGRGVRVCHREFIGNVVASSTAGAFNNISYALNPGMASTFPWLSTIAQNFDQWQPNGIVVTYKSLSSSYSGTASLGAVVVASDYDVYDQPYSSKTEMENSQFCVSANCATDLVHPVECNLNERFTRVLNVRSGNVPTGDSARFYDLANLQVATVGATASQLCGELWISYDITFYKEQMGGLMGKSILYYAKTCTNTSYTPSSYPLDYSGSNAQINTNMLGVYTESAGGGAFNIVIPQVYTGAHFLIRMLWVGSSTALGSPGYILSGCDYFRDVVYRANADWFNTGTVGYQVVELTIKITGSNLGNNNAYVGFTNWAEPGTPFTVARLYITQVNPDSATPF